jgi:nicotinate-nucleotide pyrophosphorylase (carboxylating)
MRSNDLLATGGYVTTAGMQSNSSLVPPDHDVWGIVAVALAEDVGEGDITSLLTIPQDVQAEMHFVARDEMVACGTFISTMVYSQLSSFVSVEVCIEEGELTTKGSVLAIAKGPAQDLLMGERVALNFMQRMSGVATLTRKYVDAVKGTKAIILDTRKTMPGLRIIDKYAVRAGGGQNHRMRLDDMVLIKDNHIALAGGMAEAVRRIRKKSQLMVEVECDTLDQVEEALSAAPDRIMLDNMTLDQIRRAVKMTAGKIPLEASGGISLSNARAIAQTGIDYISVGKLTHSAPAADIGADIKIKTPS